MTDKDQTEKGKINCGCIAQTMWCIFVVACVLSVFWDDLVAEMRLAPEERNAAATARQTERSQSVRATATAKACNYRKTVNWCQRRHDWAVNTEAELSAALKLAGGLDGLTAREQARVEEVEQELAFYRRACEGEYVEANADSILDTVFGRENIADLRDALGRAEEPGELEKQLAASLSLC